jgi:hypothetical protein
MEVVAYATENYKDLVDIWKKSLPFEYTLKLDIPCSYIDCIERKFNHLLNFVPKRDFIISSDVDVLFFNNNWCNLEDHMRRSESNVFFMRDAVQTNLNAGFFIVKREYFENEFKQFLRHMLEEGLFRTMEPHYEQTYMNTYLKNWEFIPDEYTYIPKKVTNLARCLYYHAICTSDKYRSIIIANKAKMYQVHVCFHDEISGKKTQNILYKHPWMTPFKLNSRFCH